MSDTKLPRGKPPSAIPRVEKSLSLPSDICAQVDLQLFSELEGKVPHGAWSRLVGTLLTKFLADLKEKKHGQS